MCEEFEETSDPPTFINAPTRSIREKYRQIRSNTDTGPVREKPCGM